MSLRGEMLLYRLLFVATVLGLLCVGSGCAHTTVRYVDPARPEAHVEVTRTTFLRHGRVDIQFPINADVRIVDEPMGDNLATTALVGASIAGAVAGPAGAAAVLGGATLLGIVTAIQQSDEPKQAEQDAPPLKPSEMPPVLPGPTSMRVPDPQLTGPLAQACFVPTPPSWCQP